MNFCTELIQQSVWQFCGKLISTALMCLNHNEIVYIDERICVVIAHHLQAVYDEINAQRPDIVRHADTNRRTQKYRHNENVIASMPAMYRQVVVPAPGLKEYVTGKDLFELNLFV
jgi:hypothetical protein